jgi:PP-loop superfamily ATP-utilizing enzyme
VSGDPRIPAAQAVLAGHGVSGARVEVEGHEREIAAIAVPEAEWERMMGPDGALVARAVKAAGFRYVALDLAHSDAAPEPGDPA